MNQPDDGPRTLTRLVLPDGIQESLIKYCAEFQLAFGEFELAVTPDGEWVFLGCNAEGQLTWIDDSTRACVMAAIADLLCARLPSQ